MADLNSPFFEVVYDSIDREGIVKEVTCKFLCDTENEDQAKEAFEKVFNHTTKQVTVKKITLIGHGHTTPTREIPTTT